MNQDSGAATVMPFVLGIGVGAIAALPLAPKAEGDLREDIVEGVNDGAEQISISGRELKRRLGKVGAIAQDQIQQAVEGG
jgi:hypothetical protein